MRIKYKGKEYFLPDFLIVGAAKSATSSIYELLQQHPQIFMPKIKEPMFWPFKDKEPKFYLEYGLKYEGIIWNFQDYVKLFSKAKSSQLLGEASTWYLYFWKDTIENMKKVYGLLYSSVKILIILRNPIERAWSHYKMHKRDGVESLDFLDAINNSTIKKRLNNKLYPGYDYIGFGMYSEQVEAFLKNFKKVKIVLFENFVNNPRNTLKEIFSFLGIDPLLVIKYRKVINVSGKVKNNLLAKLVYKLIFKQNSVKSYIKKLFPLYLREKIRRTISRYIFEPIELDEAFRKVLISIYQEDIVKLSKLTNINLSHWIIE